MAQTTEFTYHNIELNKSESLGSGSYGKVCKAKCDGLLCAAKIMHPTLYDPHDPGTASYLHKFQEECRLLSLARHPNVVQYLATYCDPDTQLPVLLMELCDQSLTKYLEKSAGPLSYHIQLNICHDIALALVYLHSNGLIHRDLTGNNVLMIAGTRAKITDFGMSKLVTVNPRMTALSLCPGNLIYMSPEALDEAKSYTAKLDVFSFGVIVIQILTRKFPSPTDRFRSVKVAGFEEPLRQEVPETERRQSHLKLISDTHSLKPLVLQCLKKEGQRPSALELSERLSELKLSSQYTESLRQIQSSSDIQQMQQQLQGQRILTEVKTRKVMEHQTRITELERIVEEKQLMMEARYRQLQENQQMIEITDRKVQQNQHTIEIKDRQLQEKERTIASRDHTVEMKVRELQQTQQQLQASEQLVSEFQHSLQQKDQTISDLQQTISAHEKEIQQLEQQYTVSGDQQSATGPQVTVAAAKNKITWRKGKSAPEEMTREAAVVHGNTAYFRPTTACNVNSQTVSGDQPQQQSAAGPQATVAAAKKDISKMTWRKGKSAPEEMTRGATVVHGNTTYFRPNRSSKVYSCQIIGGEEQWSQLPDNGNENCGLAVITGLVTSVGGCNKGHTNTLLSLTGEGERKQWSEIFPPMPTPRLAPACIATEQALVVAGGFAGGDLNAVEVMNINTKQWTVASSLPQKLSLLSGTVCGYTLYLTGGHTVTKSVFTCSIPDLIVTPSHTLGSRIRHTFSRGQNVWREISSLPVKRSTLVSFSGDLLAIGGEDDSVNPTSEVYRYDSHSDSWNVISEIKNRRMQCLAVTLPGDCLIVVGGYTSTSIFSKTDSVEILE